MPVVAFPPGTPSTDHVTVVVVVPVTVAVNSCWPEGLTCAEAGDTTTLTTLLTVRLVVPLTPLNVAVIVEDPTETAVASPFELIVATLVVPDVQVALELTFPVDPSL